MEIDVLSSDDRSLRFILKDGNPSLANALRRVMTSEVPVLAIEDVEFIENSSSLYDEVLAHRLGLIPIKTDLSVLNFRDECKCESGCPSCQVEFTLKKKGPAIVYSDDLKSTSKTMKPLPGIPLVKLGKKQAIELKATAVLGTAKEHAKWQPAVVGYKYYPRITISERCTRCGDCVEACPRKILVVKKDKLTVTDEKECILCRACMDACGEEAITVEGDDKTFIYEVESTGGLEPIEIATRSCDILMGKAQELASRL
ncbi:MAG: DNA-directed RNA polymerase subunit D [Methanobacteriota archaeon]|nr:MAG: DNA-directed RNA polymerase subunit D [Euryarchaeota archaeon]